MTRNVFIVFLLLRFVSWSQENNSKQIFGKITTATNDVEAITVINRTKEITTISDKNGEFFIRASVNDELVFSSISFKPLRITVSKEVFDTGNLTVHLQVNINQLDAVLVNYNTKFDAVSLGILQKEAKKYTVAERRLYANSVAGAGAIVGLINILNGQNKINKKIVAIEKIERNLEKMNHFISTDFIVHKLGIEPIYVEGFKHFVIEEKEVIAAINSKNKLELEFILTNLAVKYNQILKK